MAESSVYCNHCEKDIVVEDRKTEAVLTCPHCQRLCGGDKPEEEAAANQGADQPVEPQLDIEQLLPPKFLAEDPEFIDYRQGPASRSRVFLPDGEGGLRSVDGKVVRIEHQGQTIELIALSPEQRRRRQKIINTVVILLGLTILILIFFWL